MHRTCSALLSLAAAALLVSGCSTAVPGTPAAGAPAETGSDAPGTAPLPEAVTWVDGVCGSLLPFVRAVATPPKFDPSDPEAAVAGLTTYLGGSVAGLDTALAGLGAAGPSPVAGGDEAVATLTTTLTAVRTSFQEAKTKLAAVDPSDPQQVGATLPDALAPLQELAKLPDASAGLKASPELDQAAQQAPNCRALRGAQG